ncbi:uncharacterized protein LOC119424543 [Nematolebias whitei]|uniref:uncharacterized protein LOC119424543 n=1 Tax=Nematolebias whitei TaxID=451745 RepID=UPI0018981702|nr:uncharacterized protein LOC119424543 [Nematolebias whitei]
MESLIILPFLFPHTDLQRELSTNKQRATAAVQLLSEEKSKPRIQQSAAACAVNNTDRMLSDEWGIQHRPLQTYCTGHHFIPDNYNPQFLPPSSSVISDVFQLVPFKPPGNDSRMALSNSGSAAQKPAETADVFLQTPFGKRQETSKAAPTDVHIFKPSARQLHNSKQHPLNAWAAPLHTETPLLQQPMAVHRVVSRVGQQAAVGSVAVGPLRSWTIVGKTLNDPFNAAPFQPRWSKGKP